jgi:ligand-binding sensor domain-containing protein
MPASAMPQSVLIDSSDRLLRTSDLLSYDAPYTMMTWLYVVTAPGLNVYDTIFSINVNSTSVNYDIFDIKGIGSSQFNLLIGTDSGDVYAETSGPTALASATWYHVCIVRAAANSRIAYLDGAQEVNHTSSVSGRPTVTRNEVGGLSTSNLDVIIGRFAGIKLWRRALSRAEVQAERLWLYPVNWRDLYLCTPLRGGHNDLQDVSGAGRNWTAVGTLTTADGPPAVGLYPPAMLARLARGR